MKWTQVKLTKKSEGRWYRASTFWFARQDRRTGSLYCHSSLTWNTRVTAQKMYCNTFLLVCKHAILSEPSPVQLWMKINLLPTFHAVSWRTAVSTRFCSFRARTWFKLCTYPPLAASLSKAECTTKNSVSWCHCSVGFIHHSVDIAGNLITQYYGRSVGRKLYTCLHYWDGRTCFRSIVHSSPRPQIDPIYTMYMYIKNSGPLLAVCR